MDINLGITGTNFHNLVAEIMKSVAADFQSNTVQTTSRPSAPDTSKFSAIVYGMIEYHKGVYIHGGQYGISRQYLDFMKIGTGVDLTTRKDVFNEFVKRVETALGIVLTKGVTVHTTDHTFRLRTQTEGSAWGGFGFTVKKRT